MAEHRTQGRYASNGAADLDAAFNRVLAAEAEARAAIERSRQQAAAMVANAEHEARAIARRAERRIRAAHRIADSGIASALAELAATAGAGALGPAPDAAAVDAVAAALAAELTAGPVEGAP